MAQEDKTDPQASSAGGAPNGVAAQDDQKTPAPGQAPDNSQKGQAENSQQAAPTLQILGQYIRDLSFENPGAPASMLGQGGNPQINVNISVQPKKQTDDVYAVELALNAKATREDKLLYNIELVYGGVFRIAQASEAQLAVFLMIECPRLIFPFANQILSSTTQSAGFLPFVMQPVDFAALYRQNMARMAQAQKQATDAPEGQA